MARLLIEHDADVNARNSEGKTPLHTACRYGNLELVQLLLDQGASVYAKDRYGHTPIYDACCGRNYLEIVGFLVRQYPCLLDAHATRDNLGWTPMSFARYNGHLDIVHLLVLATCAAEEESIQGWSPLHAACRRGRLHMVELLISHGADPYAETSQGETPFNVACRCGHLDVVWFLVRRDPLLVVEPLE